MTKSSTYGLVGKSLSHSFSKTYFEKKFSTLGLKDSTFSNFELHNIEEFAGLLVKNPLLNGLSVTIPYKETIVPFLDDLDPEAREIGAVNCIRIRKGKTTGYNTDVYGFTQSIKPFLDFNHQKALILGTGGASKAIAYALHKIGVEFLFVSSTVSKKSENVLMYSEINALVMQSYKFVVNCTPLGMFPATGQCPALPYEHFRSEHLAFDLIYNPEESLFLKQAKANGAIAVNGLSMLQLQAEKSWEIWNREEN